MCQIRLDSDTLKLFVYADGSFSNNRDLSSHLGFIIFSSYCNYSASPISLRSYRSRRVVRSVLGAYTSALADAFDQVFAAKTITEKAHVKTIPMRMLTDSKSLFDVIVKEPTTSEKILAIDLKAIRDSFRRMEISVVGFIRS